MKTSCKNFTIEFGSSPHAPIQLPEDTNLSEALTICNSPVLFGCRTGICGTCLIHLEVIGGKIEEPKSEEKELLNIICSKDPKARLACQIHLTANITISPIPDGNNGL